MAIGNWQLAKKLNRNGRKGGKGDWKSGTYFFLCVLRVHSAVSPQPNPFHRKGLTADCYVL
jgi:hypothetical protein